VVAMDVRGTAERARCCSPAGLIAAAGHTNRDVGRLMIRSVRRELRRFQIPVSDRPMDRADRMTEYR
jgi:hypothetical protein